jgi:hypothetical protein
MESQPIWFSSLISRRRFEHWPLRLGRLSEQHMRIEDENGSLWRHKKKQKL